MDALLLFCGTDMTSQIEEITPQGPQGHTRKLTVYGNTLKAYEYIFTWMYDCHWLGRIRQPDIIHENALCQYWHILHACEDLHIDELRPFINFRVEDIIGDQATITDIGKVYETLPNEHDLKAILVESIVNAMMEERLHDGALYTLLSEEFPEFDEDVGYALCDKDPEHYTDEFREGLDTARAMRLSIVDVEAEKDEEKDTSGDLEMAHIEQSSDLEAVREWRRRFWS